MTDPFQELARLAQAERDKLGFIPDIAGTIFDGPDGMDPTGTIFDLGVPDAEG
jgi:hypothetical protein